MRELSTGELQLASGRVLSEYLPEEIARISAATGYTVGAFIKSLGPKGHQSSVTGLANAISFCQSTLDPLDKFVTYYEIREIPAMRMVGHFGCAIVSELFFIKPS